MSTITSSLSSDRKGISGFIKRNPLLSIYIIMFGIAWSNLLSDNSAGPFHFTVILAWAIALCLIAFTRGRLGYRSDEMKGHP